MSVSKPKLTGPWSDNHLFTLISTLALRIEDIRARTDKSLKEGSEYASEIVAEEIGNGCTASRVEKKIKQLWKSYGPRDGGDKPDAIYYYGAIPTTLPLLAKEDQDIFPSVAAHLSHVQK